MYSCNQQGVSVRCAKHLCVKESTLSRRYSVILDAALELWSRLAALVDAVNSQSNYYFCSIQINLPFEALQRN